MIVIHVFINLNNEMGFYYSWIMIQNGVSSSQAMFWDRRFFFSVKLYVWEMFIEKNLAFSSSLSNIFVITVNFINARLVLILI